MPSATLPLVVKLANEMTAVSSNNHLRRQPATAKMIEQVDHDKVMMESLLAFKRAGADGVLTYFALDIARLLKARA